MLTLYGGVPYFNKHIYKQSLIIQRPVNPLHLRPSMRAKENLPSYLTEKTKSHAFLIYTKTVMSYLTTKPLVDEKYLTGRRKDSERSDD